MGDLLAGYDRAGFLDEALDGDNQPSRLYRRLLAALDELGIDALHQRAELRDCLLHLRGVTFTISGEDGERERTLPLDLVPRVIDAAEWALVEAGLVQRVRALNSFLADAYAERRVLGRGPGPRPGPPGPAGRGRARPDQRPAGRARLPDHRRRPRVGVTAVEYGVSRG